MTITVLPIDADTTTGLPSYPALNERQAFAAMDSNPLGSVFGGRSGFRVGTLPSIVSVTSTTWTLNPCSARIFPAGVTYQGGYGWATDQVITGTAPTNFTVADPSNPRLDILYITVNDSSAGDGSGARNAPVNYLAGTPASTPVAPTLPPRSFLVATISMPKAGAGSPTITLNTARYVAAGAPQPVFTQAERDALTQYDGLQVQRHDLPGMPTETSAAGAWRRDYADTGWINVPLQNGFTNYTATSNWLGLRYRVTNGIVYVNGAATNAASWVTNTVCGALPSAYWPSGRVQGTNVQIDPTAGYLILAVAGVAGAAVSLNAAYPIG